MGESLIWDTESNGLVPEATKLHSIQIGTLDGDDVDLYCDALPGYLPISEGLTRLHNAERLVGHNVIGHDYPLMVKLHPGVVRLDQMVDTLILARLMDPTVRDNRLRTWGERLGVAKGDFEGPWDVCTTEMMDYARQDVPSTRAVWGAVKHVADWGRVVGVEHRFAWVAYLMERNGFTLSIPAAQELDADLRGELAGLSAHLQTAFPPLPMERVWTPKVNSPKFGYVKGQLFTTRWSEAFDPNSRAHLAKRLQLLGWAPREWGKDGVATVDEDVLDTLPYPEAKVAVSYHTCQKKLAQLADGKTGWLRLVKPTGRVHGRINTIGCAPGRCSHSGPNMANVNKQDKRMRGVWIPRPGWKLVGVDGEGLQARIFAHYVARYDDGEFAKRLHEGSKKDRTDVHSANLTALSRVGAIRIPLDAPAEIWDVARDAAKRCLYATWFGAQDAKLGWTAKDGAKLAGLEVPRVPDVELGRLARMALMRSIKGYKPLVEAIRGTAKSRGYLVSPLGRHVPIRSRHSALVFLEQAGEADVMKLAADIFHFEAAPAAGWVYGEDYAYVAHIHDESQQEARPEIAEALGATYAACITQAGVEMKLRCPLAGSFSVGDSWRATH